MAAEESPKDSGSGKRKRSGRRRYFRRRRRKGSGSKNESGDKTSSAPPPSQESGSGGSSQSGRRKKRRSRNRRGGARRRGSVQMIPPAAQVDENQNYQEPDEVYVYTHIIRPAYRDAGTDYLGEHSFHFNKGSSIEPIGMDRLRQDIIRQLEDRFETPPVEEEQMPEDFE